MKPAWQAIITAAGLALAAGCAATGEIAPEAGTGAGVIPMVVYRPAGKGPFPAVVLLHHCGGIRGTTVEWRRRLVDWGYVVAVPDSFTPRGFPNGVCGDGSKVTGATRARDAYAALHRLEQRTDVIPGRIAVMGHSHGGAAVLATVSEAIEPFARSHAQANGTFRAAIAYYPWCGDHSVYTFGNGDVYSTSVPLLILAGEKDDWTPAAPCVELVNAARGAGLPVEIKVYPGAHHGFDGTAPLTRIAQARGGRGATIGGHPEAREDSMRRVREFLRRHVDGAQQP